MKPVHQVIVGAAQHDAITNMALEMREILRTKYHSEIFSYHVPSDDFAGSIYHLDSLPPYREDSKIIYHLSFGIPELTNFVLQRKEEIIVHYHNVTPSLRYKSILPTFAESLDYGREELSLLKSKASQALADSQFNADELLACGYEHVTVLPAGLNAKRLDEIPIDPFFLSQLRGHFPNGYILFVSQVLPHKRVDHALQMVHLLRSIHKLDIGLVIAGPIRQPAYLHALSRLRQQLSECHVLFTDEVTDSQLATLYRDCLCYIGTSEHEGLSIPPLEAMANSAPVVARGAGAVPETVGIGGIVLDEDVSLLEFTEVVARVLETPELQGSLRLAGRQRIEEIGAMFSPEALAVSLDRVLL